MSNEEQTTRPGGKKKSPLIVKVSLDEATSLRLMAHKPNSVTLSSFCAMMVEYGLRVWEKVDDAMQREQLDENDDSPIVPEA